MNSNFLFRLRILSGIFIFVVAIVIYKLFSVQVVHSEEYVERADHQYATPQGTLFDRGTIFFTKKDNEVVSAASLKVLYKIAIKPSSITNPSAVYKKLAPYTALSSDEFNDKAAKIADPYEEVATKLTKAEADKVTALKIPGVSIYKEKIRFYPGGSLASQVLGLVAYKGDDLSGRYGVERYYDSTLSRTDESSYVNFFAEVFANIKDTVLPAGVNEGNVALTIEPTIESMVEEELSKLKKMWGADEVGGVIMNPKDGSIYAMANWPNFDPNDFSAVEDARVFGNPTIENVYEFGSVIKPLTLSAGLDVGAITPETTYDDKGFVIIDNKQINNFDKQGRGPNTSMQDVLNESLNTGSVYAMQKMGRSTFKKYMLNYGIGEKTGIDLPNETSGLISNLKSNREIEYATAAFGQGIAITPIEAARAFSAIANGGRLITPHVTKEIQYMNGQKKEISYPEGRVVLKPETAHQMTQMLTIVADTMMKTYHVSLPHYSIAIKTGTAQIPKEDGTGYYTDKNLHSMFAYFPAYDPQFLVFYYVKNPKGSKFAAQTLSSSLIDTASFLLNYYDVVPDL